MKSRLAIFGVGDFHNIKYIKEDRFEVVAFIDNDKLKQGHKIDEIPIISPQQIKDFSVEFVLINSKANRESMCNELAALNLTDLKLFYDLASLSDNLYNTQEASNKKIITDDFLIKNKIERMDANRTDIFNKIRCDFHLDRYRFACEYTENKVVLDIASGLGYGADCLFKLGRAKKVYGVEFNQEAVNYANEIYSNKDVSYKQGSILEIPFEDNSFDIVTSFETLEHIENEIKQLQEIKRVLKPKGYYILSTPNDWNMEKNPHHVKCYDYFKLKKLISEYFQIEKIYNQNSGDLGERNHNMPRSIVLTTEENYQLAECLIVVAKN
ncbi:MAG: class I SAM-dependent methyltransferase [bacterium]